MVGVGVGVGWNFLTHRQPTPISWVTHTHHIAVSTLPDVEDDVKLEDGWDSID